jgi:tripartite-type tricarboxylate transporter receptor subunit TctC
VTPALNHRPTQRTAVSARQPVHQTFRRELLRLAAGAAVLTAVGTAASAQTYPARPITMVAFRAGGPSDIIARILAEGMRGSLGQPVIIENVAGASGSF